MKIYQIEEGGDLAEKKLSAEFLKWLNIQIDDCGGQTAFGVEIGAKKGTVHQWVKNIVGRIDDDHLEKLMRYMAQLPGDRKIIAASTSDVKNFVENGIMPDADLNDVRNITLNTALNYAAVCPLADAAILNKACSDRFVMATRGPHSGSEQVRRFILESLKGSGIRSAAEFLEGLSMTDEEIARCDRWLNGTETIPRSALPRLSICVSNRTSVIVGERELVRLYETPVLLVEDSSPT